MYINRNIITLGDMIHEINFPTIAGGFLNWFYSGYSDFYPLYLC